MCRRPPGARGLRGPAGARGQGHRTLQDRPRDPVVTLFPSPVPTGHTDPPCDTSSKTQSAQKPRVSFAVEPDSEESELEKPSVPNDVIPPDSTPAPSPRKHGSHIGLSFSTGNIIAQTRNRFHPQVVLAESRSGVFQQAERDSVSSPAPQLVEGMSGVE